VDFAARRWLTTPAPQSHYDVEGRLPWADIGKGLPAGETRERW
jgi:hypothetical protein